MDTEEWANLRQITPSTPSQPRKWTSSASRWRERRLPGVRSEPIFRPPTSLFGQEGIDSAAKLPAIADHGGVTAYSHSRATTLYGAKFRSTRSGFGGTALRNAANSTAGSFATQNISLVNMQTSPLAGTHGSASSTVRYATSRPDHRTGNMLDGVTMSVEHENSRARQSMENLDLLARSEEAGHDMKQKKRMTRMRRSGTESGEEGDGADFTQVSNHIASSLATLRRRQEEFVPGKKFSEHAGSKDGKNDKDAEEKEEAEKARRLRLAEYKMVKRIEPELPPLSRHEREAIAAAPRKTVNDDIIFRNTSLASIEKWIPDKRHKRIQKWKEVHDARMRDVSHQCEALERNHEKQLHTKQAHRAEAVQATHEQLRELANHWMTVLCIQSFMRRAKEELSLHRMVIAELLAYVETNKEHLTANGAESKIVKHALKVNNALRSNPIRSRLCGFIRVCQLRKAVAEKRHEANTICKVLLSWRRSGRVIMAMFGFRRSVVLIQCWWRECRKQLREQRDTIAKRWIKIERAELVEEDKRRALKEKAMDNGKKKAILGAELILSAVQRRKMQTIDEATRTRFIENELRTLRYLLLPKIELWQEERKAWNSDLEEWHEDGEAHRAVASNKGRNLFKWPPVRPTFMPPPHFRDHSEQAPACKSCPDRCPGPRGDAMILDMWKRARQSPENYTRIPESHQESVPKNAHRTSRLLTMLSEVSASSAAVHGAYGPPPSSAEQRKLGVVSDMPGVHIHSSPALHEGEARAWVSQLAVASSMAGVSGRGRVETELEELMRHRLSSTFSGFNGL